jgi:long-chain acyl-CoA synthetase
MPDPFSLLPLALAAHGGRVDDYEIQQLVAAGLTLLQRSAPLVRALAGKRSAILLPTSPQFLVALAASEGRGAVLINPLASAYEIAHEVADANVGAAFTVSSLAAKLPEHLPCVLLDEAPRSARVVVESISREVDLGSHVGLSIEGEHDTIGSDDEAVIVYTSAMEGTPLGAILSHRNLLTNARATIDAANVTSGDTALAVLPFAHLFGLTVTASVPLLAGARVVTMPRFNPVRVVERITTGGITALVGVPSVFRSLLDALSHRDDATFGDLRLCICGGAPLSTELQDRWAEATGVELRQGYGLTEAGPVCLFNRIDQPNARGTLGTPLPGVEVRLIGDEICVRGESVFIGYVSHGDAGLAVRDGWLHTGDRGRADAAGRIVFDGCIKPMFTRHGFNIYPREISLAVLALAGTTGVRVRQLPADGGGDTAYALEVRGAVTEDDVRRWCTERLAAYKQPAIITIL